MLVLKRRSALLALVQVACSLSLSELCTPAHIRAALPHNGTILGIEILAHTLTATVSTYSPSHMHGGPGPMRRRQLPSLSSSSRPSLAKVRYCNVTFAYTHSGKRDRIHLRYGFPSPSHFRNRFYSAGGEGYSLNSAATGGLMYGAVSGATDGGYDGFNYSFDEKILLANGTIDWDATYMFGYQALGELATIGNYITKKVYSHQIAQNKLYTYYNGCSDGGREAMSQVQRYGSEYDGVIAGAPAFRSAQQQILHVFPATVEKAHNYYPPPCALATIVNATIKACDGLDGRVDGVVSRTDLCQLQFNLSDLVGRPYHCAPATSFSLGFGFSKRTSSSKRAGMKEMSASKMSGMPPGGGPPGGPAPSLLPKQSGKITSKDIEVAQAIYDGLFDSHGRRAYLSWQIASALSDAETAYDNATHRWKLDIPSIGGGYVRKFIQLLKLDNLDSELNNVTYDTLVEWMNIGFNRYYDSLQTTVPDLTAFQQNGGKLLHYHGESDPSVPAASSVHYRQAVQKAMYPDLNAKEADVELKKWYQLYMVPGAAHCGPNNLQPGPWPQNLVEQMFDWVENKHTPKGLNATVTSGKYAGEMQLLCQWPMRPLWRHGNTTFDCIEDSRSLETWTYDFNAFKQVVY